MSSEARRRRESAREWARAAPTPEARRRTRLLGLVGFTSAAVLFSAEFLRVWRLGTLPLTRGDELEARRSPRAVARIVREGYRVSSTRDNTVFSMVATFVWTFGWARAITYAIRVRGRLGPIRDLRTASGRHIHHFLPGMVLALLAGGWSIASQNQDLDRWLAFPFGLGTALVVDEAALLLELEDVYWTEEGHLSVQLAFATVGLLAAVSYLNRVLRSEAATREADWETAARAFDDLQLLSGRPRRLDGPGV